MSSPATVALLLCSTLIACGGSTAEAPDAPVTDAGTDGRPGDATPPVDAAPPADAAPPPQVTPSTTLSAGGFHTCAIDGSQHLWCWGKNTYGEVGDGGSSNQLVPVAIGSATYDAVSAGFEHTCALTTAGAVVCWGRNQYGEIGDGTLTVRRTPTAVSGLTTGVRAISAGNGSTCAVLDDLTLRCWGRNNNGQLGDGTTTSRSTPVAVTGLTGQAEVSAGASHTCALDSAGAVTCWGYGYHGQLGNGTTGSTVARTTPAALVAPLGTAMTLSAGALYTCAPLTDGRTQCWGNNLYGELGNQGQTNAGSPVAVITPTHVRALATGDNSTCAVTYDKKVRCWGRNTESQLGDGTVASAVLVPTAVIGIPDDVEALDSGAAHTCARTVTQHLYCWGNVTFGQLGSGDAVSFGTALRVVGW